jgi:hypothetical protein
VESGFLFCPGEEAEVTDADESLWKGMEEEAADELCGGESHHFVFEIPVVTMSEGDLTAVEGEDAAIGESDALSVSNEIFQDDVGTAEGWLSSYHPGR